MTDQPSSKSLRQAIIDLLLPRHAFNKSIVPKCDGDEDMLDILRANLFRKYLSRQSPSTQLNPELVSFLSTHMVSHNLQGIPKPFASNGNSLLVHIPSLLEMCGQSMSIYDFLEEGIKKHIGVALSGGGGDIAISTEDLFQSITAQHPDLKFNDATVHRLLGQKDGAHKRASHAFTAFCDPKDVSEYIDYQQPHPPSSVAPNDASGATTNWMALSDFLHNSLPLTTVPTDNPKKMLMELLKNEHEFMGGAFSAFRTFAWTLIFSNIRALNPTLEVKPILLDIITNEKDMSQIKYDDILDGLMAATLKDRKRKSSAPSIDRFSDYIRSVMNAQNPAAALSLFHEQTQIQFAANPYELPSFSQLVEVHHKAFQEIDMEDFKSDPQLLSKVLLFAPDSRAKAQPHFTISQWNDINDKILSSYSDLVHQQLSVLISGAISGQQKGKSVEVIRFLSSCVLDLSTEFSQFSQNQEKMLSDLADRIENLAEQTQGSHWDNSLELSIQFIRSSLSKNLLSHELKAHTSENVLDTPNKPKKRM